MPKLTTFIRLTFLVGIFTNQAIALNGQKPDSPDSTKFNSLLTSFDYSTNTSTFGRISSISTQPSYSGNLVYYSKHNFLIGLSPIIIANSDSTGTKSTSEFDINLGYDIPIFSWLTSSVNYSHYLYSKGSNSIKSINSDQFSLSLNGSFKGVTSVITGYYQVGEYNEFLLTGSVGYNLQFNNLFFRNKDGLSFTPDINLVLSNQSYYNQYAYKNYWFLLGVASTYPYTTVGEIYTDLSKYHAIRRFLNNHPRLKSAFLKLDSDLVISDLFKEQKEFNISSLGVNIPIYYSINNLTFNFNYSLYFPINLPSYFDNTPVHYFSAGISYSFVWFPKKR